MVFVIQIFEMLYEPRKTRHIAVDQDGHTGYLGLKSQLACVSLESLVLGIIFGGKTSIATASAYDGGGRPLASSAGSGKARGADGVAYSSALESRLEGGIFLRGTDPMVRGMPIIINGRSYPFAKILNSSLYPHSITLQ